MANTQITQLEAIDFILDMAMQGLKNDVDKNFALGQIHTMASHMRPGLRMSNNLTNELDKSFPKDEEEDFRG